MSAESRRCVGCGYLYTIRSGGVIYEHWINGHRCSGSDLPPAEMEGRA